MNKVNVKKRFKFHTDRFELTWHQLIDDDNERTFEKTVWETPVYVGPEAYDSSSIDNICNNARNDVRTVISNDIEWFVCRRKSSMDLLKFKP